MFDKGISKDTEILTDKGWKTHSTLDIKHHRIATWKTGQLQYNFATNFTRFRYVGEMYHLQTGAIDVFVTKEHRMFVGKPQHSVDQKNCYASPTLIPCTTLFGEDVCYEKGAQYNHPTLLFKRPYYPFTFTAEQMDAFLLIYAFILNHGYMENDIIQIRYLDNPILRQSLSLCQFSWIQNRHTISIQCPELIRILPTMISCILDRQFEFWMWDLSSAQAKTVLVCLVESSAGKDSDSCYYTHSSQLRDDFQRLALHAGWASDYAEVSNPYGHATLWRCELLKDTSLRPCAKFQRKPDAESWIHYDDIVWCVSVNSPLFPN